MYYYIQSGAITDPPPKLIWANGRAVTSNPFPAPYAVGNRNFGASATDEEFAQVGIYRLHVTDRGEAPGPSYVPVVGDPVVDSDNYRVTRIDSWREPTSQETQDANRSAWAVQAAARKDREAKAALALPDSDDPKILRRKLNAALHLIQG
jgi:hypothetical protein